MVSQFPKIAGQVLNRIFASLAHVDIINIGCANREARPFTFKYYPNNGMFRLNIPNSTPLVDWARENKQGIAYVECREAQKTLYFEILKPDQSMMEVIDRSLALGTWGRTPTRLYGWY